MAGQPVTKAEQLERKLGELALKEFLSDFEVGQLRREANSLVTTFPAIAYMALGFLAAIEGKEDETRSHFKAALRLNPSQAIHANFALVLSRLNLFSEALIVAREAYNLAPENLSVLDILINRCVLAGTLLEAEALLQRRAALHPDSVHGNAQFITDAAALMRGNGVTDAEVQKLQELATAIARGHGFRTWYTEFLIQEDEEDRWASIWFHVRGTVEQVVELNIDLAKRLAAIDPPIHADSTVGYMFVTAENP